MLKNIVIKGAKENNLKNIDLTIPRDKLVVLTGLSGSGKSSLAFDTIYAEGQRRYMESLSSYARQFLGQMEKPDVESIDGLSPAISIDQKTTSKNPRSTVGTVTEIYDYLRLLYARIGTVHCPVCGRTIEGQTVDQIADSLMTLEEKSKLLIMAPVVRQRKGSHEKILRRILREGFARVRIDGEVYRLGEDEIKLGKNFKHTVEIVVDRIKMGDGIESRLAEACELALEHGESLITVEVTTPSGEKKELLYSTTHACPEHGPCLEELEPRTFSFNSPFGACPNCKGLGFVEELDPHMLIEDENLSLIGGAMGGALGALSWGGYNYQLINALAKYHDSDLETPFKDLPENFKKELIFGTGDRPVEFLYKSKTSGAESNRFDVFEGAASRFERRYKATGSDYMKEKMSKYMELSSCRECGGKRLRPEVLAVTVGDKNIIEFCKMSIGEAVKFLESIHLNPSQEIIAKQILKEIRERLSFLIEVGLDYLTLYRSAGTLSGGESQRIRLATQIGSGLVGVLYILDEPSIGLHQRDNDRLLAALRNLTEAGNTMLVVEHDEDTMYAADYIVDIGPGAGDHGGEVVCAGTVDEIKKAERSVTGQYLSGKKKIHVPEVRRTGNGKELIIRGARCNNLKNIDVAIPLGKFVSVTGVSGSGKSSLINEILYKGLANKLNGAKLKTGEHDSIEGIEYIDKIVDIDQSPIGRTPRSNPATYTGVFTHIRELFAQLPDSKMRGYEKRRFSFNVKGGRCEACSGDGIIKIEMHFLPDVYIPCEVCKGKRYNRETLEVKYKGKNIFDVLDMTVNEAHKFFKDIPSIKRYIETLEQVGMGYIKLGQPSTQLSGGEAQRIKLATELTKRSTGNTIYILDEPTTGLHFADVDCLLKVLDRLADGGNTVVVIEHNLDVIKHSDYIIDLGPEGGFRGGTVVTRGTPEEVAKCRESATGSFLKF